MAPIPGGYPLDKRIEGAVQARVNQSALGFLQDHAADMVSCVMPGGLDFCIPSSSSNITVGTAYVCEGATGSRDANGCVPGDRCDIHIEVKGLALTPKPGLDTLGVEVRLLVYDTTKNGHPESTIPIRIHALWDTNCSVTLDTERSGNPTLGFKLDAKFSPEPVTGYTQVSFANIAILDLDPDDISISGDFPICDIAGWFKGTIISQMTSSLTGTVQDTLNSQLCQKCADVSECPAGIDRCEGGVCKFGSGTCLQSLGTEGRIDVGAQLASVSPGLKAYLDIMARMGGSQWGGQVTSNGGLNLGLFGGARAAAHNECVPLKSAPPAVAVPPAPMFTGTGTPPVANAHIALGVHDSFLNAAAFGAWDAGTLCIDAGSAMSDMLNSGTFSILVRSLGDLTHGETVPVKLSIRPQNPPVISLGAGTFNADGSILDPLLKVTMQDFALELFVLIDERYVRVLTIHTDITLPLGMRVNDAGQLEVVIGDVKNAFQNVSITDSGMLSDKPEDIAAALPQVLGVALPFLATAFPPIDVPGVPCTAPDTRALKLAIPPGGITSVEGQRFLGIFATLDLPAAAQHFRATATAEVAAVDVPPTDAFAAGRTFDPRRAPTATLKLGGFGLDGSTRDLEWTYRVDRGFWSPFLRTAEVKLEGGSLWLQGRHKVEVRARVRDVPESTSETVTVEVIVDSVAPTLGLTRAGAAARFTGRDGVTPAERLEYAWRVPGGQLAPWSKTTTAPLDGRGLEVSVRDEAGNVTTATLAAVTGEPAPTPSAAAGCAAGGAAGSAGLGLLLAAGALFLARRRRAAVVAALLVLGLGGTPGCSCGGSTTAGQQDGGPEPGDPIYTHGAIGRYSSLAADATGKLFVTAYEENYGDLVFGTIGAPPDFTIAWEIVDGVPQNARVKGDAASWRYGIKEIGDNVGFYTSLVIGADGMPRVAYRENTAATRDAVAKSGLKYAARTGTTCERSFECWTSHVVDDAGNAGYYANLTIGADGNPTIAYLAPAKVDATTGAVTAELRFAIASTPTPTQASDWNIIVVDSIAASCAGVCPGEQVCVTANLSCAAADPAACAAACGDAQACVAGTCVDVLAAPTLVDLPQGAGLFVKTVRDNTGRPILVYYDRVNGDLKRAMVIGSFSDPWDIKVLDAEGDVGQFPSAVIDDTNVLHVAYADAGRGRLLYYHGGLGSGATPIKEVVDDGRQGQDGPHAVGWDAQLAFDASGQIHILYQDGRTADLLHASRAVGAQTWTIAPARQDAAPGYGFFTRLVRTAEGLFFSDYRYDRNDTPTGVITKPEDAVKPLPQGTSAPGKTFGWLEVGQL
ncbi:MAG TPA: hypothetical protein VGQ83_34950 [Polyangia bacterium]